MEVYRFRVKKGWYAYIFEKEAKKARQYFLDMGYPSDIVSEIEKSDERDFQFKINPIAFKFGGVI